MKIKSSKPLTDGKVRLVIELEELEYVRVIKDNAYYRLGGQLDDIVATHVLEGMQEVFWCSIEQKWMPV